MLKKQSWLVIIVALSAALSFDTKGNFIGILTGKYVGEDVEGIGFAIPADLVLEF